MTRLALLLLLAASLSTAACRTAPEAAAVGKTVTAGSTTVTTSGSVRVDGVYVD